MYDSPTSLQECCIDFICENITAVCEAQASSEEDGQPQLTFYGGDIYIHEVLSEWLLETLGEMGKLDDSTLSLFDSRITNLKRVRLRNGTKLTTTGLRTLRSHKIVELEAKNLTVTVNELIGCLGEWTVQNLRSLNVAHGNFANTAKVCVAVSLPRLRHLQTLNVCCTEFNKHCLDIVATDLQLLENLDISCTKISDISPLRKCKDRLRTLKMYNLQNCRYNEVIAVVLDLHKLEHLDISDERVDTPFNMLAPVRFRVAGLFQRTDCLPHLISLDISGKEDINMNDLSLFLDSHPSLNFLGLVLTNISSEYICTEVPHPLFRCNLTITGSGSESQILEALRRYTPRILYIQKSLFFLFRLTQNYTEPRVDIIKLILPGMQAHPKQIGIQMAATACLYNLSKGELGQKIHPKWLRKIVELTMTAMENFPTHPQLQKNTLLTLCSDRILQEVTFDKYRCARLVMDCLCEFEDPSMNRMCVAICSILAAKISTDETSLLGAQPKYMKKLLDIVKTKVNERVVDITMKFTLSALWNLTDESPCTCSVFLEQQGLHLFLAVLERFPGESAVETKVLGLVNNIAEVKHLRSSLMLDTFIASLRTLLQSSHIDVSYFAAGIIAHLASDGVEAWNLESISRQQMLDELSKVVLNWETPEGEMVAYRSFNPFFPLLNCDESHEVQLWAVWAMQHVCNRNYKRYCPMLIDEGGVEILQNLLESPNTHHHVRTICKNILKILDEKGPFYLTTDAVNYM